MRRATRTLTIATLAVATAALAGCGTRVTAGDGDIGGDWVLFDEPKVPTPVADVCRTHHEDQVDWQLDVFLQEPVTCDQLHESEAYYIGTFTGATAQESDPPDVGDAGYLQAYQTCATQASTFLGGDWHRARAAIVPVLPADRPWDGEARWFRCEILETRDATGHVVTRKGSMRDGLRGKKPLAVGCANFTESKDGKYITQVTYVACAKSHQMEMTGVYTAPNKAFRTASKEFSAAADKCYDMGAKFLGLTPGNLDGIGGIQWIAWGSDEVKWSVGDRGFRCYMGPFPTKKIKGTIKGKSPYDF